MYLFLYDSGNRSVHGRFFKEIEIDKKKLHIEIIPDFVQDV